jgi:hypothetical protein
MSKPDQGPGCGAWLEVSTAEGRRRTCVLRAGHYREREGPAVGEFVSWHTDCPDVANRDRPMLDHVTHLVHGDHRNCTVWADWADGAHPSDVTPAQGCVRCGHDPNLHTGPDGCHAESCLCALSAVEALDEGLAEPVQSLMENVIRAASDGPVMAPVDLPAYRATVHFRDGEGELIVSATLYGPAEFLATAVSVIAEEFQKEVEK